MAPATNSPYHRSIQGIGVTIDENDTKKDCIAVAMAVETDAGTQTIIASAFSN
jgi:hypothetical protein